MEKLRVVTEGDGGGGGREERRLVVPSEAGCDWLMREVERMNGGHWEHLSHWRLSLLKIESILPPEDVSHLLAETEHLEGRQLLRCVQGRAPVAHVPARSMETLYSHEESSNLKKLVHFWQIMLPLVKYGERSYVGVPTCFFSIRHLAENELLFRSRWRSSGKDSELLLQ